MVFVFHFANVVCAFLPFCIHFSTHRCEWEWLVDVYCSAGEPNSQIKEVRTIFNYVHILMKKKPFYRVLEELLFVVIVFFCVCQCFTTNLRVRLILHRKKAHHISMFNARKWISLSPWVVFCCVIRRAKLRLRNAALKKGCACKMSFFVTLFVCVCVRVSIGFLWHSVCIFDERMPKIKRGLEFKMRENLLKEDRIEEWKMWRKWKEEERKNQLMFCCFFC